MLSVAVVMAGDRITPDDLPQRVRTAAPAAPPAPAAPAREEGVPLNLRDIKEWAGREAQKRIIMELQTRTNISRQELARMLGVDPKTLRSRLKEIARS